MLGETQQNHYINYPYGHNPHPNPLPRRGNKFAFTLAEVLITLVIIGVIAAITVPSLINKTNNQEYVSRLKKTYSTLAQVTNQIIAEEGPVINWIKYYDNVFRLYKNKLINAKECNMAVGCSEQGNTFYLNSYISNNYNNNSWNKLVLQDGTQIIFSTTYEENCLLSNVDNDGSKDYCRRIFVDINGAKKPNTFGKDVFAFVIKRNGLYPAGCDYENLCNKTSTGLACACKVLREGVINY